MDFSRKRHGEIQPRAKKGSACRGAPSDVGLQPESLLQLGQMLGERCGVFKYMSSLFNFFPPNSVSTLRGSYGKCTGGCLIRVLTLGASLFPVNFKRLNDIFNSEASDLTNVPKSPLNVPKTPPKCPVSPGQTLKGWMTHSMERIVG